MSKTEKSTVMEGIKDLQILHHRKNWLARMTDFDQDVALRHSLENGEFDAEALNACFGKALSNVAPDCLDIIAKFIKRKNVTISIATPYNCLITSGKRYQQNNLVKCIRVLIDNGFDVHEPNGLYPLYTLVKSVSETQYHDKWMDTIYESVSLLLSAGANPNFRYDSDDEVSPRDESASAALAYGFGMSDFTQSNFLDYCKYFSKYIELFVKYGCDVSEKNNHGKSLLVDHFKTYFEAFSYCYEYYDKQDVSAVTPYLYKIIGCLIYGGATLQRTTEVALSIATAVKLRVHLHFLQNSDTLSQIEHAEQLLKVIVIGTFLLDSAFSFLKFMNIREAQEELKVSLILFESRISGELTDFRKVLTDGLFKHLSSFFSLQTLCMVKVWKCAGKRFTELGLPTKLEDDIRGMLHMTL